MNSTLRTYAASGTLPERRGPFVAVDKKCMCIYAPTVLTRQTRGALDMLDEFSEYYADFLDGTYDCVDRFVLNAYFGLAQSPGGFRTWWRGLKGSDEGLDNTHLMRMAGRVSRRVRAHAKAHQIPIIDCKRGERKPIVHKATASLVCRDAAQHCYAGRL